MIAEILLVLQFLLSHAHGEVNFKMTHGAPAAQYQEFPYQVSIQIYGRHVCGGSLISNYHVLTAAHCFKLDRNLLIFDWLKVRVGSTEVNQGAEYSIRRLSRHRDYRDDYMKNGQLSANDIAVLTLRHSVTFSAYVRPISLPMSANFSLREGTWLLVSGFGAQKIKGSSSPFLRRSYVSTVSKDECHSVYGNSIRFDQMTSVLCAKMRHEGGVCSGDSGGPLVYDQEGQRVLVGVVCAVIGQCGHGYPDLYANVAYFLDYIDYEINYDFQVGDRDDSPALALDLDRIPPAYFPRPPQTWYPNQPQNGYYSPGVQYVYSGVFGGHNLRHNIPLKGTVEYYTNNKIAYG